MAQLKNVKRRAAAKVKKPSPMEELLIAHENIVRLEREMSSWQTRYRLAGYHHGRRSTVEQDQDAGEEERQVRHLQRRTDRNHKDTHNTPDPAHGGHKKDVPRSHKDTWNGISGDSRQDTRIGDGS